MFFIGGNVKNDGDIEGLVEDISLIVGIISTFVAVTFGSFNMLRLSIIFFGLSDFRLVFIKMEGT